MVTLNIYNSFIILTSFSMLILNTNRLIGEGIESEVGPALGKTLKDYSLSILIEAYSICFAIFLLGLNGYHTYLISTAQTTNEQLKKSWKLPSGNPYQ